MLIDGKFNPKFSGLQVHTYFRVATEYLSENDKFCPPILISRSKMVSTWQVSPNDPLITGSMPLMTSDMRAGSPADALSSLIPHCLFCFAWLLTCCLVGCLENEGKCEASGN